VDTPQLLALYVPLEKKDSFLPELTDPAVKEAARRDFIRAESIKMSEEAAKELIESLKETSFTDAAKALSQGSPELGSTPLSARREILSVPGPISLSDITLLIKTVFSLSRIGESATEPIPVNSDDLNGYLVLSLRDFKAADDKDFEAAIREWRSNYGQNSATDGLTLWLTSRTGEVKIRIPPELQAELNRLSESALL
jgi:hypothetical protein